MQPSVVATAIGNYADVLCLGGAAKPEVTEGTALVRVLSAGVAFPDVLVVEGKHMMRRDPPFTPGQEVCGTVVAVGDGVTAVSVGQRVFGPCLSGGLADYALVDCAEVFVAPESMDPHVAAGFELNYGTTWHALVDLARLQRGETLLVLGASGGVGISAIAIGVALGARVVACASTDDRLAACRDAGAHEALSYAGGGKALKAALTAAGLYGEIDVVLDPVGGELSEVALRATGWGGRFLVVGFASGGASPKQAIPKPPLNLALLNERAVLGVFWGAWKARPGGREANRANVQRMLRLIERGDLRPPRGRVYAWAQWRQAFDDLMQHRAVGKVCVAGPSAAAARL